MVERLNLNQDHRLSKMSTKQYKGILEVDYASGVIYFHSEENGITLLRICGFPKPIEKDISKYSLEIVVDKYCSYQCINENIT